MDSNKLNQIFTLFLLFIIGNAFSQKQEITIEYKDTVLGKNLLSGDPIPGRRITFSQNITMVKDFDHSGRLLLDLRETDKEKLIKNKGCFIFYDPAHSRVLWQKPAHVKRNWIMVYPPQVIFYEYKNEFYKIDTKTGEIQWKLKYIPYFIDTLNNIGLGYRLEKYGGYANTMEAFRLDNGNPLWHRKINKQGGWPHVFYIEDSLLMIIASGLHTVHISNGKGWDINAVTHDVRLTGATVGVVAGVILGGLIGGAIMGIIIDENEKELSHLNSNLLIGGHSFFASKDNLFSIDLPKGILKWNFQLPFKTGSASSLFLEREILFMVNYGYGSAGNRYFKYGKPFFAAFRPENGQPLFSIPIGSKNNFITDYDTINNSIFFVLRKSIQQHNLSDGEMELSSASGEHSLSFFVDDRYYIRTPEGSLIKVTESDPEHYFIFTDKNDIVVFNDRLEVDNFINFFQIYFCYLETERYRFIARNNQTIILDHNDHKIAEVTATGNAVLVGNKLYDHNGNNLIEIDLSSLFENEK